MADFKLWHVGIYALAFYRRIGWYDGDGGSGC